MKTQWAFQPFVWGSAAVTVFFVVFLTVAFFPSKKHVAEPTPIATPSPSPSLSPLPTPTPLPEGSIILEVGTTPTGWLRVRDNPSVQGKEVARVNVGDRLISTEQKQGWYSVTLEDNVTGWVSGDYVKKVTK